MTSICEDDLAQQTMYQLCLQQSSFFAVIQNPSDKPRSRNAEETRMLLTSGLAYQEQKKKSHPCHTVVHFCKALQ